MSSADISRALQVAVKTGKVTFGYNESLEALRTGKAKLIVVAKNLPVERSEKIFRYAEMLNIPVLKYDGSSIDLGVLCEKPYTVSTMAIREVGDSEILKIITLPKTTKRRRKK
ncbi:MAG: 50S ribosomal protein L30e [Candidatus Bathyarchaeota archaeon]|nr:50S ribosomal protein L30e [Candidatus Bathyarchaeota archaeon]